jgi:hypothetical protein
MPPFSFLDLQVSPDWVGYSDSTVPFKIQGYDAEAIKWKVKCRHQNQVTNYRSMVQLLKLNQEQFIGGTQWEKNFSS